MGGDDYDIGMNSWKQWDITTAPILHENNSTKLERIKWKAGSGTYTIVTSVWEKLTAGCQLPRMHYV